MAFRRTRRTLALVLSDAVMLASLLALPLRGAGAHPAGGAARGPRLPAGRIPQLRQAAAEPEDGGLPPLPGGGAARSDLLRPDVGLRPHRQAPAGRPGRTPRAAAGGVAQGDRRVRDALPRQRREPQRGHGRKVRPRGPVRGLRQGRRAGAGERGEAGHAGAARQDVAVVAGAALRSQIPAPAHRQDPAAGRGHPHGVEQQLLLGGEARRPQGVRREEPAELPAGEEGRQAGRGGLPRRHAGRQGPPRPVRQGAAGGRPRAGGRREGRRSGAGPGAAGAGPLLPDRRSQGLARLQRPLDQERRDGRLRLRLHRGLPRRPRHQGVVADDRGRGRSDSSSR